MPQDDISIRSTKIRFTRRSMKACQTNKLPVYIKHQRISHGKSNKQGFKINLLFPFQSIKQKNTKNHQKQPTTLMIS